MTKAPERVVLGQDRAQTLAGYPHARRAGSLLFLSGLSSRRADNTHDGVEIKPDGSVHLDIRAQTRAVIENMAHTLAQAGLTLADLVDVTTYLVNMDDYAAYNEVWNDYFTVADGPARTTLATRALPHPNLLIEMKGIAHIRTHHE